MTESLDNDEDYDDFSEDFDDLDATRNYVSLNVEPASDADVDSEAEEFTPLTETLSQITEDVTEETVEEFFDEEDTAEENTSEEEAPATDN